ADRNRSHWSTSKTPSYTKSVSWQHHPLMAMKYAVSVKTCQRQNTVTIVMKLLIKNKKLERYFK
ncbi:hypothetical protein, partial [Citrobacter portucalensis]|uniref:hypothetical protein n=1 Tax=Citrobacter portucalensis TaxID=1639133 RepID=UPI00296525A0